MNIMAMLVPLIGAEKIQEFETVALQAGARMMQAEKDIAEIKAMVREIHAAIVPQNYGDFSHDGFDNSSEGVIHG